MLQPIPTMAGFLHDKAGALLCLAASALIAACSSQPSAPPQPATPPAPAAQAAAAEPPVVPHSFSWTVDGYKKDAAQRIYEANKSRLYDGAPPPILKSIIVLSIAIDADGQPKRVKVLRSNGYKDLDKIALQSVERAAPLPHPSRMISHGRGMEYTETWLFREDGRFQLRSLAQVQQTGLD
jgi:protein TonB